MKGLSAQQKKIVQFIRDFKKNNDCAPTIYEIAEFLMIRPSTAFAHINALQKKNIVCRSSQARSIRLVNDENKSNTCFHIPLLEHFSDVDFCRRTSQYLNYHLPQKYERFQNDLCAIKIPDKVNDQTGMILTGDFLVLIRHPDHFVLNTGTLILVWKPDGEYVFMRYNETLDTSYKIVAAVTEIQRSL